MLMPIRARQKPTLMKVLVLWPVSFLLPKHCPTEPGEHAIQLLFPSDGHRRLFCESRGHTLTHALAPKKTKKLPVLVPYTYDFPFLTGSGSSDDSNGAGDNGAGSDRRFLRRLRRLSDAVEYSITVVFTDDSGDDGAKDSNGAGDDGGDDSNGAGDDVAVVDTLGASIITFVQDELVVTLQQIDASWCTDENPCIATTPVRVGEEITSPPDKTTTGPFDGAFGFLPFTVTCQ